MIRKTYIFSGLTLLLLGVAENAMCQTIKINGNIYGGGEIAQVEGDTHVTVKNITTPEYDITDEMLSNPTHSVFGGGLGVTATVTGNTSVDISMTKGNKIFEVMGGGMNGKVEGTCNVHIGNGQKYTIYNVYGGGYYAPVGGTALTITRGRILNDVYGGGVMGSVKKRYDSENVLISGSGETLTQIGLLSDNPFTLNDNTYTFEDHKNEIVIGGSVYGGNDVSGTIETLAQTTINGGKIEGNVYGAGNGDHTGYYDPIGVVYSNGKNPDNYSTLENYPSRPKTKAVMLRLEGNSTKERTTVSGQVFGGGNSCTIEENGVLTVQLGSHVTIGQKTSALVNTPYLNEEGENVSGLFMGSSGAHLAQQPSSTDDQFYHRYHNDSGYTLGFQSQDQFDAYVSNILVKSDNVSINVDNNAEDIWLANFVGGGFRGSMQAYSSAGKFSYTLPMGVTVGNAVVGGAYDAFIRYKESGADKYVFKGGILAENAGAEARKRLVLTQYEAANAITGTDKTNKMNFSGSTQSAFATALPAYKDKALLKLELRNAMEPDLLTASSTDEYFHGGNVFGGCFSSGTVEGDSWVDYRCYPSEAIRGNEKFQLTDETFDLAKEFIDVKDDEGKITKHGNFAQNVFGAGYGAETENEGDTYIRVLYQDNTHYPTLFNVFGGSFEGEVGGNTNIYYNAGMAGYLAGGLYGGGCNGYVNGKTFLEIAGGFIHDVYGGARNANIGGGAHVWAYDGNQRWWAADVNATEGPDPENLEQNIPLFIGRLFGGTDISGKIGYNANNVYVEPSSANRWNAVWTKSDWTGMPDKLFESYVQIGGSDVRNDKVPYPVIGQLFAGGNGEATPDGHEPNLDNSLLDISDGNIVYAFGGGNKATVEKNNLIFVHDQLTKTRTLMAPPLVMEIMKNRVFNVGVDTYTDNGTSISLKEASIQRLFGGNNVATMAIQPTWNLYSGRVGSVYSGGNMGDMTYYNQDGKPATKNGGANDPSGVENNTDGSNSNYTPRGLSITVEHPDIHISALYGGCRLSDVIPGGYDTDGKTPLLASKFTESDDYYGATVNITDGYIENVYGGNDISGKVFFGTNVNISGAVSGNVYGSGNGCYLYKWDQDATGIEEYVNTLDVNDENSRLYYTVPANSQFGGSGADNTQKILTINAARPSVEKAFLNIAGLEHDVKNGNKKRVAYVKGNVYCGGNASTVNTADNNSGFTKFKIGSYVTLNGVFMGSDGWRFSQEKFLKDFEKINGFDLAAAASVGDEVQYYPNLLSVYMKAVEMKAQPKDFNLNLPLKEAHIGTYCGGGNRGSVLVDKTVTLPFHHDIIIYDKVVAACLDANVTYNGAKAWGGYTRPISDHATYGNTKMDLRIASQFAPMEMDVPDNKLSTTINSHGETFVEAEAHDFLYPRMNNKTYATSDAYTTGCNIYGGCFQSGEIEGDVILNVYTNMLRYVNEDKLKKAIANNQACFNIYGSGYGTDSHVWGNVKVIVDRSLDTSTMGDIGSSTLSTELENMLGTSSAWNIQNQTYVAADENLNCSYPSFNNVFGGGRNGQLFGNSQLEIRNGRIYSDVVGGSFASDMYGSTQIVVGYPKYYECTKTGEYSLTRGDQWNTTYNDANGNPVLKTSVKYMAGDLIPENVWSQMTTAAQSNFELREPLPSNSDRNKSTPNGWNDVHIQIGGGVYGGGYSLANSTTASAGTITTHKLSDTEMVNGRKLNFDGRWYKDSTLSGTTGYGGNSSIMIGDNTDQIADATKDHIRISTPVVAKNGDYSGVGGIYGDGHLTFCEGFRAADITGYGYAEGTPKNPILMNTFQRLDLLSVNDCCLMLRGAQDFATDAIDATIYSITRINELRMNSTIDKAATLGQITGSSGPGTDFDKKRQRNYLAFFNNVHYLGSFVTNDEFVDNFHSDTGVKDASKTYLQKKDDFITAYSTVINNASSTDDAKKTAEKDFKKRNVGTARNAIGINNGFCLRIQNQYYTGSGDSKQAQLYYGPIVGVCEVKLLTLVEGEGGGYVYADNVHENENHFLNTSGNFVFPGIVNSDPDLGNQYIVDDCFRLHFGTRDNITKKDASHDFQEAHYWFVEGNKYFYNTTLTGYTYNGPMIFELIKNDPNVLLSGISKDDKLVMTNVKWISNHRSGYAGVLQTDFDNRYKTEDYKFDLEVGGSTTWTQPMPRDTETFSPSDPSYNKTLQTDAVPQFNVRLVDNREYNEPDFYENHLDEPEKVKIILEGTDSQGSKYTYTITLNIVYLKGPSYTGGVKYLNCALPGERIAFSSEEIMIETDEKMPITGHNWKLLPLIGTTNGKYGWDPNNAVIIPESQYSVNPDGSEAGWIDALYSQNRWNVAFTFTVGGQDFPVLPVQDISVNPNEENRMIIVHNYHKMGDVEDHHLDPQNGQTMQVATTSPSTSTIVPLPGARVYIEDEADLKAFITYLNKATSGNASGIPVGLTGIDFILQNDIALTEALPAISQSFDGIFHGDGYHIDLNGKQNSLFGGYLSGKVYNLGLVNGTIASSGTVENTYVYTDNDSKNEEFKYGKKAYELSHHFTPAAGGYVEKYYVNGDYQYARIGKSSASNFDGEHLRTSAPNYESYYTNHRREHEHDVKRWDDTEETNVPLYDGSADAYNNDYLFFGQHLDKTNADAFPLHISPVATGDDIMSDKGGNRVYKTAGYYHSKANDGFYYNKDAWALQHKLTAVDYTNMTSEGDGADSFPGKFSVDNNSGISQNLLVYNAGEDIFTYKDVNNSEESSVLYHNIEKGSDDNFSTEYFHLVDKQCFNAPIAFNVNSRAWYERVPEYFRNVSGVGESYTNASAWEGICLPFTVQKVMASENGEISHFYGTDISDIEKDDHTLHHEYWLNGMTSYDASSKTATFMRPAKSGEVLFTESSQVSADYAYPANSYFTDLQKYIPDHETREEIQWYNNSHTFKDYVYLTAGVPYIVSFPGNDFYEFSLEGTDYDLNYHTKTGDAQTITFESRSTTIKVSDDEMKPSNSSSASHYGTYMHTENVLGMNDTGSEFETGQDALPFRTYMKGSGTPLTRSILIMDPYLADLMEEEDEQSEEPEEELGEDYLKIWAEGRDIVIKTSEARSFTLYRYDGTYMGMLNCQSGINRFSQENEGVYLVGREKLLLR